MAEDRAHDSRRVPHVDPKNFTDRANLVGAPGSTAQPKPGRNVPEGGSRVPTAPAKKAAFNPHAIAKEMGANNFNAFSSGPSTSNNRTRFEGE